MKINLTFEIPFFNTILSNENFDEIESFENYNLKIEKNNDIVEIVFKNTYSPNIFIYENNDKYWMCLNPHVIYEQFGKDKVFIHYKAFKKLILTKNNYTFIDDENLMWSVDILSNEAVDILNNWIIKYKNIINSIDSDNLIIEQSSGIDTRILSYFWRNTGKSYNIYTILRECEIEYSMKVINYIDQNFPSKVKKIYNNKNDINVGIPKISLCGKNVVNGKIGMTEFDSYDKLCKILNNMILYPSISKHQIRNIVPFFDKEYLKIKGEFNGQLKLVLFDILASENGLNNLPIMSFDNELYDMNNINYPYKHISNKLRNKLIF